MSIVSWNALVSVDTAMLFACRSKMDEKATIFVIEKDKNVNVMPYFLTKGRGIFLNFTRKNKNTTTKGKITSEHSQKKLKGKEKTEVDLQKSSVKRTIIGSISAFLAALTITSASSAVQGLEQRYFDIRNECYKGFHSSVSMLLEY